MLLFAITKYSTALIIITISLITQTDALLIRFGGGKGCTGRGSGGGGGRGGGGTYHLIHHLGEGFGAFPGTGFGGFPVAGFGTYPVAGFGGYPGSGISPQFDGFYPSKNLCNMYGSYGSTYPCYSGYSGNTINCWFGGNDWYGKSQYPQYYQFPCNNYPSNCNYYPNYRSYYYFYRH